MAVRYVLSSDSYQTPTLYRKLSSARRQAQKDADKSDRSVEISRIGSGDAEFVIAKVEPHGKSNPSARSKAKRMTKALKKYLHSNPKIRLPANWKMLPVRVNPQGKVQIGLNAADLGSGGRFARAVCAEAGIRKYGKARMERMAQAGRKRTKKR